MDKTETATIETTKTTEVTEAPTPEPVVDAQKEAASQEPAVEAPPATEGPKAVEYDATSTQHVTRNMIAVPGQEL